MCAHQELSSRSSKAEYPSDQILRLIANEGPISMYQIARKTGRDNATVLRWLRKLKDARYVTKVGKKATGGRIAHPYNLDFGGLLYAVGKNWLDEPKLSKEIFRFFSLKKEDLMRDLGLQSEKALSGFMKIFSKSISNISYLEGWVEHRMSKEKIMKEALYSTFLYLDRFRGFAMRRDNLGETAFLLDTTKRDCGLALDELEAIVDYFRQRSLLDIKESGLDALEAAGQKLLRLRYTPETSFSLGCHDICLIFKMKVKDLPSLLLWLEEGSRHPERILSEVDVTIAKLLYCPVEMEMCRYQELTLAKRLDCYQKKSRKREERLRTHLPAEWKMKTLSSPST